jgi:hypothetical protein
MLLVSLLDNKAGVPNYKSSESSSSDVWSNMCAINYFPEESVCIAAAVRLTSRSQHFSYHSNLLNPRLSKPTLFRT